MALPTGLVPAFVFVLTVGIAVPVTVGSHLIYRNGNEAFSSTLRGAFLGAGVLYLVGSLVVWVVAGGIGLWEIPVTLLVVGVVALIVLMVLPLMVGQRVVQQFQGADRGTALRFATYGWAITMFVVFGIFLAPGGVVHGNILSLGGERVCLVGFCGISVSFAGAVILEAFVALLGPGGTGLVLHVATNW